MLFGRCIQAAIKKLGRRVAFIASGDLSHRLKPDAPAGYFPGAHKFDEEIVAAIDCCATQRIVEMDQELRRAAGECGYRSMLVAIGATQDLEWFDPDAVTTSGGTLKLQLSQFPNHNLRYRSGMLNSWNQICFKGGALEVSLSLAG